MDKQQLQKLAGLLKEEEDFDLSDNPLQMGEHEKRELISEIFKELEEGTPVTTLRDDIVKIFPEYAKQLEAFAQLENDLYDTFEALYMEDAEDEELDEVEDFDLSDNPIAGRRYRGFLSCTYKVRSSLWEKANYKISLQELADYVREGGDYDGPFEELLKNDKLLKNEVVGFIHETSLVDELREWDRDVQDEELKITEIDLK
jgi:hypothetical protein